MSSRAETAEVRSVLAPVLAVLTPVLVALVITLVDADTTTHFPGVRWPLVPNWTIPNGQPILARNTVITQYYQDRLDAYKKNTGGSPSDWGPADTGAPPPNYALLDGREGIPDVCMLHPRHGPCNYNITRWAYNTYTNSCESFLWGGCYNWGNNFMKKSRCEEVCVEPVMHPCGKKIRGYNVSGDGPILQHYGPCDNLQWMIGAYGLENK